MTQPDVAFEGSIPAVYDQRLVPMLFEAYADDIAARVAHHAPERVLEIAAGTGVVTRALGARLPATSHVVATDLNAAMLAAARAHHLPPGVEWAVADARALPFADDTFDAVVCAFGAMFFPDRRQAFAEARRLLERGGRFHLTLWDRLDVNELPCAVDAELRRLFPEAAPTFIERVPYAYFDDDAVRNDLRSAGFDAGVDIQRIPRTCHAIGAYDAAVAFCHGTPLRNEIIARDSKGLDAITRVVAAGLQQRFGDGPFATRMQALVVEVQA